MALLYVEAEKNNNILKYLYLPCAAPAIACAAIIPNVTGTNDNISRSGNANVAADQMPAEKYNILSPP